MTLSTTNQTTNSQHALAAWFVSNSHRLVLATLMLAGWVLFGVQPVSAQLTWTTTTDGTITEGSGTWQVGVGNWSDGATHNLTWSELNAATIGGGTAGTAGTITLGGNINFNGAGSNTLRLDRPNSGNYTIDLNGFTLTPDGGFGAVRIDGLGAGTTYTIADSAGTGAYNLNTTKYFLTTGGGQVIVSAKVTGTGGIFKTSGPSGPGGNNVFLTNNANDFTGQLYMQNNGKISVTSLANSGVASAAGKGSVLSLYYNGTLEYTGGGTNSNREIRLGGNGAGSITSAGSGALVMTGAVTVNNVTTNNFLFNLQGANTGNNEIQGNITDSPAGAVRFQKTGSGTWILSGNNTYTGTTTVSSSGRLLAGSTTAFGNNSAVTINNSADLELQGFSNSIGSLAGSASARVEGNSGTPTLTTGGNNSSTLFQGTIDDNGGVLSIVKTGTGEQRLTGTQTYTGTTTINGGSWKLDGTHNNAGNYTVNSGGTLAGDGGTLDGTALQVTFNAGSAFDPGIFDFNFGSDLTDVFDISGAVGSGSDSMLFTVGDDSLDTVLMSASTLTIGSGLLEFDDFQFTQSNLQTGSTYTLFDAGTINGSLGAFNGGVVGGFAATIEIQGDDLVLVIGELLIAPEPSTVMLIATGGWILAMARRRRQRQNRG